MRPTLSYHISCPMRSPIDSLNAALAKLNINVSITDILSVIQEQEPNQVQSTV